MFAGNKGYRKSDKTLRSELKLQLGDVTRLRRIAKKTHISVNLHGFMSTRVGMVLIYLVVPYLTLPFQGTMGSTVNQQAGSFDRFFSDRNWSVK